MYSFMTFGLAFFARPVGAIVFCHYGDRIGRKSTLVASLMLMGASTLLIAFLPTYAMVGWVAPLLLCILRLDRGSASAASGAGRRCSRSRMRRPGGNRASACFRSLARR